MRALLSIKPVYVNRILEGTKRFEFRKRGFAREVQSVVVYASAPISKVVAEFSLEGLITGSPEDVWSQCQEFAGIAKEDYDSYFANSKSAVALRIGKVTVYECPEDIRALFGVSAPQSFCYIP